jgi:trk system potassium uptake protein TrkA
MYVMIVGCGRLGGTLAVELSDAGHDVAVIDRSQKMLDTLGSGFNGLKTKGIEFDTDILREAGIERADYILAVTSSDSINITVSLIAEKIFHVPGIVARINDPNKKSVFEKLEIKTINPTELSAYILKSRIEEMPI